ncbi:unnamed protein product [Rhizopus microsporus]|nr:hypothetical protein RMCBS344292_02532 [Rhizopus microsporus]
MQLNLSSLFCSKTLPTISATEYESVCTNRKSIVIHGDALRTRSMDNITLFDLLFTKEYNRTPSDQIVFAEASDPNNHITYGQLQDQVLRCAFGLKRMFNIQHGDVVVICSPNSLEYPVLFYGIIAAAQLGGVAAPIRHSTYSSFEETVNVINIIQPKAIIVHESEIQTVFPAAEKAKIPMSNILVITSCIDYIKDTYAGAQVVDSNLFSNGEAAEPYPYTKDDLMNSPCCLYLTSASTGDCKVVMIQQSSLVCLLLNGPYITPPLRCLALSLFSFVSGLRCHLLVGLFCGSTTYITKDKERTLEDICKAVQRLKINFMIGVPCLASGLVKQLSIAKRYDLSSMTRAFTCGTFMDKSIIRLARKHLNITFINVYGMTEALEIFANDEEHSLAGSVGRLVYGALARIVDEDGNDLPIGEEGELRIKSPMVTLGYQRNPEATAELFDNQGYLKTGDIFRVDKDGYFYFITRKKDLIKAFVVNIFPIEIEQILINHPQVTDCAVIGIHSKEEGLEVPRAYVSLLDDSKDKHSLLEEIRVYADSQLPDPKRLRGGVFEIPVFPRTASGKIQRFKLRQMVEKGCI